jgi:peptidyl-prolyl cis-trans isomerase C
LLQEAKRIGLCAEPLADDMGRRETETQALIRGVIGSQVRTPIPDGELPALLRRQR